jgi:hypothetical protein
VTSVSGCSANSESVTITINTIPEAEIIADGPTSFCAGDSVGLTASGGETYQWSNSETTQTILVESSGTYLVTVTNAHGCIAVSDAIDIDVHAPDVSIAPDGNIDVCDGDTVTLISSQAEAYLWSNGDTTQAITVHVSDTLAVMIMDTTGCTALSAPVLISFHMPDVTVTADSGTKICAGNSVTLIASHASSYLWSTGDTTQSIVVLDSGTYSVIVTDTIGCVAESQETSVTVHPLPLVPVISAEGAVLTSSAPSGNQWYLNGMLLDSITAQTYHALENGSYTVIVTDSNGCTVISEPFLLIEVGLRDLGRKDYPLVIPNPNNGTFRLNLVANEEIQVVVFDLLGEFVYRSQTWHDELDLSDQPRGVYFIVVHVAGKTYFDKLSIQ